LIGEDDDTNVADLKQFIITQKRSSDPAILK
jgi:hypothetical protein